MKYQIYSIRDVKTDQFANPMFMVNDGHAIRTISDAMRSKEEGNMLASHPSDFEMYKLGMWDSDTGLFEAQAPRSVVLLSELVNKSGSL